MNGYLKNKIVYLCGPLGSVEDDGKGWRQKITPRLEEMGVIVSDPTKSTLDGTGEVGDDKKFFKKLLINEDFAGVKKEFWKIVRKDLKAVEKSDFIIMNYMATVTTVGSWHEAVISSLIKKPILLKYDRNELDIFNPWVVTYVKENEFFAEWDDMFKYLSEEIDNRKFTSSKWIF